MIISVNKNSHRKYALLLFAGLIILWAVENFILQASAFSTKAPSTRFPFIYQEIRFIFNLLAASAVLCIFNRVWLMAIAVFDCLLSLVILAFNIYFHKALSFYYGIKTANEALNILGFAIKIIPLFAWLLLLGALTIKLYWIYRLPPKPVVFRRRGALIPLLLFTALILTLQISSFSFTSLRLSTVKRAVYVYGYMTSWIVEIIVAPDTTEVSKELIELQKISPDRLVSTENPWPIGDNIVILQLESLDYNIINYKINGQEITPYINQLARDSRFFKLKSYHEICTADMDFATLSGGTPSARMISYMIPGISYSNSLPRFMKQHGYNTVSWHGNNGEYFNRRTNFMEMGFNELLFEEELNKRSSLANNYWGVRDREIFRLSSEKIRAARGREFHFIITLDSHGPFDFISDQEKEIFPNSKQWQQNYFNSMRVLDRDLKKYLESLPAGTLVILYGDHTSGVNYGDYTSRHGSAEFVPCIVHVCKSLSSWPRHDQRPLTLPLIDDLRILDIINYLRRQVALSGQGKIL